MRVRPNRLLGTVTGTTANPAASSGSFALVNGLRVGFVLDAAAAVEFTWWVPFAKSDATPVDVTLGTFIDGTRRSEFETYAWTTPTTNARKTVTITGTVFLPAGAHTIEVHGNANGSGVFYGDSSVRRLTVRTV